MPSGLSRRSLLFAAPAWAGAAAPSLKEAASRAGLRFGSDSDVPIAAAPAEYASLFAAHCDLLAPNLSWARTAPEADGPDPAQIDPNVAFAHAHGMRLTGAHLLWHLRTPEWFARLDAGPQALAAMNRHIGRLAGHFAGQVYSWNVVNEAIDIGGGDANGFRKSILAAKLGPGWVPAAFRAARAADPQALLLYNDYALEMDTPAQQARRDAMMRMLDHIQRNAPIDGVGLQSHLRLDGSRFDAALYGRFLRAIAGRGLKIVLTELDVLDLVTGPDPAVRDQAVAGFYRDFLGAALAEPAVQAVVLWGLSDRYTWLTAASGPNYVRPDGLAARPLPFDAGLQPKPAFDAILTALRQAPRRPLSPAPVGARGQG